MTHRIFIILVWLLIMSQTTSCFNLSPIPNVVLRKPNERTFVPQNISSYFGYSVNLRKTNVMVGAPKAQSSQKNQKGINETGAVYRCNLNNRICTNFNVDTEGNKNELRKDYQMLGAAMDGHESEADRFVVCAPKLNMEYHKNDVTTHYLFGICYWVANTNSKLTKQQSFSPPTNKQKAYGYYYPESGFSVHVPDGQKEFIVGCPGVNRWRGSVMQYDYESKQMTIPHTLLNEEFDYGDHTYFGYAVDSMRVPSGNVYYVASAPRNNKLKGEVFIFDINKKKGNEPEKAVRVLTKVTGRQIGEYFGYSVLAEDFNNDKRPDLVVSAPLFSKNGDYENGKVYVYINEGNVSFWVILVSTFDNGTRSPRSVIKSF